LKNIELYFIPGKIGFSVNSIKKDSNGEDNKNSALNVFSKSKISCFYNNKEIKILNFQKELKKINTNIELYLNQVII